MEVKEKKRYQQKTSSSKKRLSEGRITRGSALQMKGPLESDVNVRSRFMYSQK